MTIQMAGNNMKQGTSSLRTWSLLQNCWDQLWVLCIGRKNGLYLPRSTALQCHETPQLKMFELNGDFCFIEMVGFPHLTTFDDAEEIFYLRLKKILKHHSPKQNIPVTKTKAYPLMKSNVRNLTGKLTCGKRGVTHSNIPTLGPKPSGSIWKGSRQPSTPAQGSLSDLQHHLPWKGYLILIMSHNPLKYVSRPSVCTPEHGFLAHKFRTFAIFDLLRVVFGGFVPQRTGISIFQQCRVS